MVKKKWELPRLSILTKGSPEESVLCSCKNSNSYLSNGPNDNHCSSNWGPSSKKPKCVVTPCHDTVNS